MAIDATDDNKVGIVTTTAAGVVDNATSPDSNDNHAVVDADTADAIANDSDSSRCSRYCCCCCFLFSIYSE